jgi:hypothetical protein
MADFIEHLLLDELFQIEIAGDIDTHRSQVRLSEISTHLQVDEDGNIISVNDIPLENDTSHQLSYLIGSINFLFVVINERVADVHFPRKEKEGLLDLKERVIGLIVDLISELSQSGSNEGVIAIIERIGKRKLVLKKMLGQ